MDAGEIKFFQQDFFNTRRWEYVPEIICFVKLSELDSLEGLPQEAKVASDEDELYLQDLRNAINSFGESLKKVVLISRELYLKEGVSFQDLLGTLLKSRLGYHYGMWDEEGGILGSTPEILISKKGSDFKSMALASTRPFEKKDELLTDAKELYEHQVVIEDIQNKLSEQRNLNIGETGIERFGSLAHLRTDICFQSELAVEEVTSLLSPTAALGGYPKDEAKKFIEESAYHTKHPARKYGGIIGIEKQDDAFALVAIRNIQWDKKHYWIECGGGVVGDSTVENEMAEVHRKRKVIKDLFFKGDA